MSEANETTPGSEADAVKDDTAAVGESAVERDTANESNEIEVLKSTIEEMQQRLQAQSQLVGKLNNAIKREAKAEEKQTATDKPKGDVSKYHELERQMADIQERYKRQEKASIMSGIELALVEAGAKPEAGVPGAPGAKPGAEVPEAPKEEKEEKKKEKKSQKERPRSKKKHTKIQVWKLYEVKDGKLNRKNEPCPRCGAGTFLASYKDRKYCGKCGWSLLQKAKPEEEKK